MTATRKHAEFGKPKPGESLDDYLRRVNAHPEQPNASEATEEQENEIDETDKYEGGGMIIGKR